MKYSKHNDGLPTDPEIKTIWKALYDCLANSSKHFWKRVRIADNYL